MILLHLSNIYIEHKPIKKFKSWDADVKTKTMNKHKFQQNNQTVKQAITKIVEKYYNKK